MFFLNQMCANTGAMKNNVRIIAAMQFSEHSTVNGYTMHLRYPVNSNIYYNMTLIVMNTQTDLFTMNWAICSNMQSTRVLIALLMLTITTALMNTVVEQLSGRPPCYNIVYMCKITVSHINVASRVVLGWYEKPT